MTAVLTVDILGKALTESRESDSFKITEPLEKSEAQQECLHMQRINGVCQICGDGCHHAQHSLSGICSDCGEKVKHEYNGPCCEICGAVKMTESVTVPDEIWEERPNESGTVEVTSYNARDWTNEMPVYSEKHATVYLPYNYDPDGDYDLLIMIPGLGCGYRWALNTPWFGYGDVGTVYVRNMLDNMIGEGLIKPMIVVNIGWGRTDAVPEQCWSVDMPQMANEIRYDLLPHLVGTYALYAHDDTEECIRQNREHFGVWGYSYGSMIVNAAVIPNDYDLFAWFASISPSAQDMTDAASAVNRSDLELGCYIMGTGAADVSRQPSLRCYSDFVSMCASADDGVNAYLLDNEVYGHDGTMAMTALYNSLLLFFENGGIVPGES